VKKGVEMQAKSEVFRNATKGIAVSYVAEYQHYLGFMFDKKQGMKMFNIREGLNLRCGYHGDWGYAVAQLVEILCYIPEGRGFDSRWSQRKF
jgi:hypothetical protein